MNWNKTFAYGVGMQAKLPQTTIDDLIREADQLCAETQNAPEHCLGIIFKKYNADQIALGKKAHIEDGVIKYLLT